MNLKDKLAVITGGASGLGEATAKMLLNSGAKVVLLDLNQEQLEKTGAEIGAATYPCDISNDQAVDDAFETIKQEHGSVQICINCAGVAPAQKILSKKGPISLEHFRKTIDINLVGTLNCLKNAAAQMAETDATDTGERGVIINTASIAASEGQIGQAAYSASKGGVVAMTLPIARELASLGIRVVTISPGLMATPMLLSMPQEVQDSLSKQPPFPNRFGLPEEYARLVRDILENPMINGTNIRFDGAMRMAAR